jgi:hypothetical protein
MGYWVNVPSRDRYPHRPAQRGGGQVKVFSTDRYESR